MASMHIRQTRGKRGRAAPHARYALRVVDYSPKRSRKYEDLEYSASGNMPIFAAENALTFWQSADEFERANGSAYREIEVALPRELTPLQRRDLVEDFIKTEIGTRHPYTFAIHVPRTVKRGENPHAHIMFSERILDVFERRPAQFFMRYNSKNPELGGCKKATGGKTSQQRREELIALRGRWADLQNRHLEKYGHAARVDHRTLKQQGIERVPQIHLGPFPRAENIRDKKSFDSQLERIKKIKAANAEIEMILRNKQKIDSELSALSVAPNQFKSQEVIPMRFSVQPSPRSLSHKEFKSKLLSQVWSGKEWTNEYVEIIKYVDVNGNPPYIDLKDGGRVEDYGDLLTVVGNPPSDDAIRTMLRMAKAKGWDSLQMMIGCDPDFVRRTAKIAVAEGYFKELTLSVESSSSAAVVKALRDGLSDAAKAKKEITQTQALSAPPVKMANPSPQLIIDDRARRLMDFYKLDLWRASADTSKDFADRHVAKCVGKFGNQKEVREALERIYDLWRHKITVRDDLIDSREDLRDREKEYRGPTLGG